MKAKTKVDPETCNTCLFFDGEKAGFHERGVCRRYPPSLKDTDAIGQLDRQPTVCDIDWCGEYSRDPRIT